MLRSLRFKSRDRKNVYELVGLYKSMRYARVERAARTRQPIGALEQAFQSLFATMNKLQVES